MKLQLGFAPFHSPTSPPFGIACLQAAIRQQRPQVEVVVADFNLAFFRRWLLETPPDICVIHPDRHLAWVCPSLMVSNGDGERVWRDLTALPSDDDKRDDYMTASLRFDELFQSLAAAYRAILTPWIEDKRSLERAEIDILFSAELAKIESEEPDVLGLSILTEHNLLYSLALGRAVKDRLGIPIAFGGAMMSHLEPVELLGAFPWIDYVFWGEAERSVVQFIDGWGSLEKLESVEGLAHRGPNGPCRHRDPSPPVVTALPFPDFSGFEIESYLTPEPVLPVITSRGCYWGKCTFCSHTRPYAPGVRVRNPVEVVNELEHHVATWGARTFLFVDEAISPKTLAAISREILERELDFRFGAEGVRVERQFDNALLGHAYRAGLRWVYVGVESSSQTLLDRMEKGISTEATSHFIDACREAGITTELSFIIGVPGTNLEDLRSEAAFLEGHPADTGSFVLLLGSPLYDKADEYGIRIEDRERLFQTRDAVVHGPRFFFSVTEGLSPLQADIALQELIVGERRKQRTHLGEVHATLLADTPFFEAESRPPRLSHSAQRALSQLQDIQDKSESWILHVLGCLEASNDLTTAWEIFSEARHRSHRSPEFDTAMAVHEVGLLVAAGDTKTALAAVKRSDAVRATEPVLRSQVARAAFQESDYALAAASARFAIDAGYETFDLLAVEGLSLARLGRLAPAEAAFRRAETIDWYAPWVNDSIAECLNGQGRAGEAAEEVEKAARKRLLMPE